jgi:hypothetical protein
VGRGTSRARCADRPFRPPECAAVVTGLQILELAKQAGFCIEPRMPLNSVAYSKRYFRTARSIAEVSVPLTLSRSTCS